MQTEAAQVFGVVRGTVSRWVGLVERWTGRVQGICILTGLGVRYQPVRRSKMEIPVYHVLARELISPARIGKIRVNIVREAKWPLTL